MASEYAIDKAARPDSKPIGKDLSAETCTYGVQEALTLVRARLTLEMYDLPDLDLISEMLGLRDTGHYRRGEVYRLTT